jgi:hypothetical protein
VPLSKRTSDGLTPGGDPECTHTTCSSPSTLLTSRLKAIYVHPRYRGALSAFSHSAAQRQLSPVSVHRLGQHPATRSAVERPPLTPLAGARGTSSWCSRRGCQSRNGGELSPTRGAWLPAPVVSCAELPKTAIACNDAHQQKRATRKRSVSSPALHRTRAFCRECHSGRRSGQAGSPWAS